MNADENQKPVKYDHPQTEEIAGPPLVPTGEPLHAAGSDDEIDDAAGTGESGTEYKFAAGGTVKPAGKRVVCSVCGLAAGTCHHPPNLTTEVDE
jgi:hypothetical protein